MKALLLLTTLLFLMGCDNVCGNKIFKTLHSPSEKYQIIIFERNCGATTGFSTQISIINANNQLTNETGNVFIVNGHPRDNKPRVKWISDQEVEITFKNVNHITRMKESFSGLKITYRSI